MSRLVRLAYPYWPALAGSVFLMAIVGAMQALTALLIGPIFDRVLSRTGSEDPVALFRIPFTATTIHLNQLMPSWVHNVWSMTAFAILAVFLLKGVCDYLGNYLINYVGFSAVADLRRRVFSHVLGQDAQFFESNTTGTLMSSIMNDIEKIQTAVSHMLADWLRQIFSAFGLLIVLLQQDWKLALVSLTLLPFVLIPTARIGKRIRKSTRRAQDDTAGLTQILQETLTGHAVVKSFSAESIESERFGRAAQRLKRSSLRYVAQQALSSPLIEFFGAVTIVGLVTYARSQILAGKMTPGAFTSFVIALLMLYEPVKRLTGIHNIFQQAAGAAQKVFEYLDQHPRITDRPGAKVLSQFQQAIEFRDAGFFYPSAPSGFRLDNINLTVNAGEIVALVGPSGSGKSTLATLVPRFHDVSSGAVIVDGADVRDWSLGSLRSQIGIVAQDTFLFNDTVLNNIRYGRPLATEEEVRAAARAALAEEFIEQLPEGYLTIIGERGTRLSGGQRQRIAIARALLKNAPILILDEATSHLDTESEILVQRAISTLITGRTAIVIAHRLSTIRRADKIVVLDGGRIAEIGTHQELVSGGGIYQRLHALQYLEPDAMVNE